MIETTIDTRAEVAELGKRLLAAAMPADERAARRGQIAVVHVDSGEIAFGRTFSEALAVLNSPAAERVYACRLGDVAYRRPHYFPASPARTAAK